MSETIFRVEKNAENPYVMIDKNVFEDTSLSFKAKGILGYLLSRPNDWTLIIADIQKRSTDGKDSVKNGIDELIERGYIVKTEQPRQAGKFATCDYVVYEKPMNTGVNRCGKTVAAKPSRLNRHGKSATTNNNKLNNEYKESEKAPAQNSEIDLSTEKPTAIETFEFLKQSLVFGSEFGVISERQPNLSEINALVTEVDCFWSNKHLTKKQLLGKILGSVNRLSTTDRLSKYTVTQSNPADAPVVENWDSRQGEQISDFVAPLPMKGFVRWKHYTAQT